MYNKIIETGEYKKNPKFIEYLNLKNKIDQTENLINKCGIILEEMKNL